jgi:hypothetical protein
MNIQALARALRFGQESVASYSNIDTSIEIASRDDVPNDLLIGSTASAMTDLGRPDLSRLTRSSRRSVRS